MNKKNNKNDETHLYISTNSIVIQIQINSDQNAIYNYFQN